MNDAKDPFLHHLPPQSIEAEESLLSAILIDNTALNEVMEVLLPEDFYRSAHQKIFSAVTALFSKGDPVDLVTLSNHLREAGQLETVGGATYLVRLIGEVPLAVNPAHYAKIIHDKACLRRLIGKVNEVSKRCFEDRGDVEDLLEFAQSAIYEISQQKVKPSFHRLGQVVVESFNQLEKRQGNRSMVTGVTTGFSRLDALTSGFQNSDLIILAARPSMGKTAFALNIARNAALNSGIPTAVFSLEMSKEQLALRMLCSEARIDSSRVRTGYFSHGDWERLRDAAGLLFESPIFIDDSADLNTLEIRAKARRLKLEQNLGLVVIDYIQLMKGRLSAERRDLEISEISRSLKALAKELNIPVVALSQLNRKLEERNDKRPQLADLRESGALEQDADVVMFIYRDEVYNRDENNPNRGKAEIIIAKQRNGPIGTAHLTFLNAYTRFEDMADEKYRNPEG